MNTPTLIMSKLKNTFKKIFAYVREALMRQKRIQNPVKKFAKTGIKGFQP